jgi:hypothetical protein
MTDLSQPQQKPLTEAKIPLEKFNLSMRAYNCLKRAQVNFVSDLMNFSYEDLLEIKSFGSKSADEVIDALESIGMSLRQGRSPALAEQPVRPLPLDSKLPGAEDINEDGYCWLWDNYQRIWDWTYIRTRTKAEMYDYTHWLPANAIPLPDVAQ